MTGENLEQTRELLEVASALIERGKDHLGVARRSIFGRWRHLGRSEGISEAVDALQELANRWTEEIR